LLVCVRLLTRPEPASDEDQPDRLTAEDAIELCEILAAAGVRYWVVGGWGVDALLGRETRRHKDLDILALVEDLPLLRRTFAEPGFSQSLVWEEKRWINSDGERSPTAFVVADAAGRAIDIHLFELRAHGHVIQHYDNPWPLPDSFAERGTIGGVPVPCVTRETQIRMHTGYELPREQQLDLELLRRLA
jgi:lincosamide nucleotidyltransferase A/C/D/E